MFNKELIVSRICAGFTYHTFMINGKETVLRLGAPTLEDKYYSNILYEHWFRRALKSGVMTESEALFYLGQEDIWNAKLEQELTTAQKNIDSLKIALFESILRSVEMAKVRETLDKTRRYIRRLETIKGSISFGTAEFVGRLVKQNYLALCNVSYEDGRPYCDPKSSIYLACDILNDILEARLDSHIEETELRLIARTEPWHSIWAAANKSDSLFGVPASMITLEQQALITWSGLYENIHEFTDCPTASVISDDDMLDGYLLIKQRERDADNKNSLIESKLGNSKIANSQEIYLMADTQEDAKMVYEANDPHAKRIIQQRSALIQKVGTIKEQELPDVKLNIQTAMNQAYRDKMTNG